MKNVYCNRLLNIVLDNNEINCRRQKVRKELLSKSSNIKNGVIENIEIEDLEMLFLLYDKYFFKCYFENNFKSRLVFSLSTRLRKCAAKTLLYGNMKYSSESEIKYEIRIGITFFSQYYDVDREIIVNGIKTKDALHAMMLVFEHEICHVIEFYLFKNSSCRNKRFKVLARNIFGHKDVYHRLPLNSEVVGEKYGIKVGNKTYFEYEGKVLMGIICAINKRATVMVMNNKGKYIDKYGNRYVKFYIPINLLNKKKEYVDKSC